MTLPVPQRNPSLATLLTNAISSRLLDVHTALPAKVERYDATKQLVDVKPLVKAYQLGEDDVAQASALPVICNVPMVFPGAGGFRLTFPVQVGDTVLLLFGESSLDVWQESSGGRDVDPMDHRRHNLSDAIAIPGLHTNAAPWTGAATDGLTLGKDGGAQVKITDVDIILKGGSTPVAKEGSATTGHQHVLTGTAGPYPIVGTAVTTTDTIAVAAGSANIKVP